MIGPLLPNIYNDLKKPFGWCDRRVRYVKKLKENEEKLREVVGKLEARRRDIEESSAGSGTNERENWIDRAKKVEEDANGLKLEYDKIANQSCRWFHFISWSRLSKDMEKKTKISVEVWNEGKDWTSGNSVGRSVEAMTRRGPPSLQGKLFFHERIVRKLISFLREEGIRRIGIFGTWGTGKTTILDSLKHNEEVNGMFGTVVSITILENWGVKELQHEIMTQLNLNVQSCAEAEENARRLSEVFQTKKCLILLDNFEKEIDLDQTIGIRDNLTDSKVVLASRHRGVFSVLKVDELIIVEQLPENEAWNMFEDTVGEVIDQFPRVAAVAQLVAKECDRLPLLIDIVASNFRKNGDDYRCWQEGLKNLRTWKNLQGINEVLESLKFCYKRLNDTQKNCFLYGALYSEEWKICVDHLVECWTAEEFFQKTSFSDGRDSGHSILRDLIDESFLVRIDSRKFVKMYRLFRHMAIEVSSQKQGSKLLVNPSEGEWDQASRISLIGSKLKNLPKKLDCPNLLTLFVQKNDDLLDIPTTFFKSMGSLQVLDLHGAGIKSLPSSLSNLVRLKALYLNFCSNLKELPSTIKALKLLEVLDIRETQVDLLQIQGLASLRCLRMSSFGMRKHSRGEISCFISLEEFSIDVDSSQPWPEGIAKAVANEVATLKSLTFLQFSFHNMECLQSFVERSLPWRDSSSFTFQFCVGCQNSTRSQILDSVDYPFRNSLKLVNTHGNKDVISSVLKQTDIFELIKHNGVSKLSDFGISNMEMMLVCWIEECDDIVVIINGDGIEKKAVLTHLKELHIKRVNQLKGIWQGYVHPGSLAQLTTLTLSNCPILNKIFCQDPIQELSDLQCLKVEECGEIEEITMTSEAPGLEVVLPKLKILELTNLPALRSILDDSFNWQWPSLEKVKVSLCPNLTRLPFNNVNEPKLMLIEGEETWWKALQWRDPTHKQNLQSRFTSN